jgi:hypothetical protein
VGHIAKLLGRVLKCLDLFAELSLLGLLSPENLVDILHRYLLWRLYEDALVESIQRLIGAITDVTFPKPGGDPATIHPLKTVHGEVSCAFVIH